MITKEQAEEYRLILKIKNKYERHSQVWKWCIKNHHCVCGAELPETDFQVIWDRGAEMGIECVQCR